MSCKLQFGSARCFDFTISFWMAAVLVAGPCGCKLLVVTCVHACMFWTGAPAHSLYPYNMYSAVAGITGMHVLASVNFGGGDALTTANRTVSSVKYVSNVISASGNQSDPCPDRRRLSYIIVAPFSRSATIKGARTGHGNQCSPCP
jgi:hypothetical protein